MAVCTNIYFGLLYAIEEEAKEEEEEEEEETRFSFAYLVIFIRFKLYFCMSPGCFTLRHKSWLAVFPTSFSSTKVIERLLTAEVDVRHDAAFMCKRVIVVIVISRCLSLENEAACAAAV